MGEKQYSFWLPHYTVENEKVLFLKNYDMDIEVPIFKKAITNAGFITEEFLGILGKRVYNRLKMNGIIIPWSCNSIKKDTEKCCLAIQPHSDDIVLSCGGFIQKILEKEDTILNLITVFSKQRFEESPWSRVLKISNSEYENIRKMEDELICKYWGGKPLFLEFEDANLRSSLSVIAKTMILKSDLEIKDELKKILKSIFHKSKPDTILFPMGIGLHRDHLIAYMACMELINELPYKGEIYLYEDYPYCNLERYTYFSRLYDINKDFKLQRYLVDIQKYVYTKAIGINFYRSQLYKVSLQQIYEHVKKLALATTYEAKLHNQFMLNETLYTESVWKM